MKKAISLLILSGIAVGAYAFPASVTSTTSGPNTCFTTITGDSRARIINNLNATLGSRSTARIVPKTSTGVQLGREFKLATIEWFNGGGAATTANIQLGLTFSNGGRGTGLLDFDMSWTGNRDTSGTKTGSFAARANHQNVIIDGQLYNIELTRSYSQRVNYMQWGQAHVYARITQAVPEPTTMAALGLGALALIRRKKVS